MESVMPYVLALVPTIGVATLFYFVMKTILEGDRRERLAQAKWEAEHRRHATEKTPTDSVASSGEIPANIDGPRAGEPPATMPGSQQNS
jgi:hypothetical protein